MKAIPPTIGDLVLLQEMCLERELRCEQRAAEAEERGDRARAEHERRLKERLTQAKWRCWDSIRGQRIEVGGSAGGAVPALTARSTGTRAA